MNRDSKARLAIREWLLSIQRELGVSPIKLAELVGTSANTIYRAMDLDSEFMPSTKTLSKIAEKSGYPLPSLAADHQRGDYIEAHHITQKGATGLTAVPFDNLILLSADEHRRMAWRVGNRALELEGYLPGDVVITDPEVLPAAGDIVCAQIPAFHGGGNETVLRLFEPPYLLARSIDRKIEPAPILLDKSVTILGTAVQMIRERRKAS